MSTSELKKILINELVRIVTTHQTSRLSVTDEMVEVFMSIRKLNI